MSPLSFRKTTDDSDNFEGMAPTRKNHRMAINCALNLSLRSGRYPKSHGLRGPYVAMDPSHNNPLDYFELLWPRGLVDEIIVETNQYARQKGVKNCLDVNRDEIPWYNFTHGYYKGG